MDVLPVNVEGIPYDLRQVPQWVCWRLEIRDGKSTKVPYNANNGRHAMANNPDTWHCFDDAYQSYLDSQLDLNRMDGVGFQLSADDHFFGGDLDKCIDTKTGEVDAWADAIIQEIDTYTERSPSGTGLRFIGIGKLPEGGRKKGAIELYENGRFLTITGAVYVNALSAINERQEQIAIIHERVFQEADRKAKAASIMPPSVIVDLDDHKLLQKAMAASNGTLFTDLWNGNRTRYSSESEADLALCGLLAFWAQGNHNRVDSLFRQSGMFREKWDKRHRGDGATYGQMTIEEAISGKSEFYDPRAARLSVRSKRSSSVATAVPIVVTADTDWDTPIPFGPTKLPPFPIDVLPKALRFYAEEVAATVQIPVDLTAMLALTIASAVVSKKCNVQVGVTHPETTNLYYIGAMEPGSRKTAAMNLMSAFLTDKAKQVYIDNIARYAADKTKHEIETKRLAYLKDCAAKEKREYERKSLEDEAEALAEAMGTPKAVPTLIIQDTTMERLAQLMSEQEDNCIAHISSEGGIMSIIAGKYSTGGGTNLDLVLQAWDGSFFRCDRVGRPPDILDAATLTIALAVQPGVLQSMAAVKEFHSKGLLGRFLYNLPESLAGTRFYKNRPIHPDACRMYNSCLQAIWNIPSPVDFEDRGRRHMMQLQGLALDIWTFFSDDIEYEQRPGGELSELKDWAGKLSGHTARIAGIMHMVENCDEPQPWAIPISAKTVQNAWIISYYLIDHTKAVYGEISADESRIMAQRILKWIDRKKLTSFKFRDCWLTHSTNNTPESLELGLLRLIEHEYIRMEAFPPSQEEGKKSAGRPQKPIYTVNPRRE